jgi:EF hand
MGGALVEQGVPMPRIVLLFLAAATASFPVHAQNTPIDEKQCADQFRAADLDNDGVLSASEIGNFKQNLPASVANKDKVTRTEFMAVCGKKAS